MARAKWFAVVGTALALIILISDVIVKPSLEDVLVEVHGLLFDIILFGVVLSVYETILEKRASQEREQRTKETLISRYTEEIDDFRLWDEKEASFRILGNAKRLKKLGVKNVPLNNCYLASTDIARLASPYGLSGCTLYESNLSGAILTQVDMSKTYCVGTDFSYANLVNANLSNADLTRGDLRGAKLKGYLWWPTQGDGIGKALYYANLKGAILDKTTAFESQKEDLIKSGADIQKMIFMADPPNKN